MKKKITKIFNLILFWVYNHTVGLFINCSENKVSFLTEAHGELNGNLAVMYDYLSKRGYELCVHVKSDRRNTSRLSETISVMRDISSSKYIFLDDFYGLMTGIKIKRDQKIIQLWHGAGAFKKFGFSRIGTGDNLKRIHSGYKKYTNVSVTSENIIECYAEAFNISTDKIKALGIPRTDLFFDSDHMNRKREKVYKTFPNIKNKKVVLIAPTYRGGELENANYDFSKIKLNEIGADLGNDYVVMVKWHPALHNNILRGKCEIETSDNITDCSDYSDINDLLLVTDVLVTDYSSVIFDYFLLNKPIVYYTYDLEKYKKDRGLYFDFEKYLYGPVATTYDQLIEAIKIEKTCEKERESFNSLFMKACDGRSTEKIFNWVFEEE